MTKWAKKATKTKPLRRKLVVSASIFLLIPITVLCIIFFLLYSNIARNAQAVADINITSQIGENLYQATYTYDALVKSIIFSSDFQALMLDYTISFVNNVNVNERSRISYQLAISHILRVHETIGTAITNITVYGIDGRLLANTRAPRESNIKNYPWFDTLRETQGESLWLSAYPQTIGGSQKNAISMAMKIRSVSIPDNLFGKEIGYILVDVNMDLVFGPMELLSMETASNFYLFDSFGHLIFPRACNEVELFPFLFSGETSGTIVYNDNNERLFLTVRRVENTGWYVAGLSGYSEIMQSAYIAVIICITVALILLVVFIFVSIFNADSVVKPIMALCKAFKVTQTGNFRNQALPHSKISELNELNTRFNEMTYQLDVLVHEAYVSQLKEQKLLTEARNAQIEALQMQINPHFIYNTLDSINWMAVMGGNKDVSEMVIALGELLRFNVSFAQLYASLENEIKNTERYLYIQQIRFQPRLRYKIDVPKNLHDKKILKLFLQPLVENSVIHGMEVQELDCLIEVRIKEDGNRLIVEVVDNGVGMPLTKLDELNTIWQKVTSGSPVEDKVGITNLMKRLYLSYGGEVDLIIDSYTDEGTYIKISFPSERY